VLCLIISSINIWIILPPERVSNVETFVIDGNNISNYAKLCKEFNNTVFAGFYNQWKPGNLDGFNDLLRDVNGTIIWKNFA